MISLVTAIAIFIAIFALLLLLQPESISNQSFENRLMKNQFRSSKHKWQKSQLKSFYFCYLCHRLITGWFVDILQCKKCGVVIHAICKYLKLRKPDCKYLVSKQKQTKFYHQWRQCTNATSNCIICNTICLGLQSYICIWCQRIRHGQCKSQGLQCDFGPLRKFILEPTEIHCSIMFPTNAFTSLKRIKKKIKQKTSQSEQEDPKSEEIRFQLNDTGKRPVILIVNKKSGGCLGDEVIKEFYRALNPLQVISIMDEGLQKLKLFTGISNLLLIIAGGDGTVCSVLNYVKTIEQWKINNPPAVVLPLGTGNDLSRSLGWGSTIDQINVRQILYHYDRGNLDLLDRWKLSICKSDEQIQLTVYNYIGIGIDGKICNDFNDMRSKYPQLFFSQFSNKLIYTQMATFDYFHGVKSPLSKLLTVKVDGKPVQIEQIENLILLNIGHWGGGVTGLWSAEQQRFKKQMINDGEIQLIGFSDVLQMGQVQIGLDQPFALAQGRVIEIESDIPNFIIPLQIDGQPLQIQTPFKIKVCLKDKVNVLSCSQKKQKLFGLINEAFNQKIINQIQRERIFQLARRFDINRNIQI